MNKNDYNVVATDGSNIRPIEKKDLIGKTISDIAPDDNIMWITFTDGSKIRLWSEGETQGCLFPAIALDNVARG